MKISIAILHTNIMKKCILYLEELMNSISTQDYKDIEVVVSDQTPDDSYQFFD